MKIVIVNDIKGDHESIIPYGLNMAKYLKAEVLLVHVVDPRVQQAVPSVVADSSSISPGEKQLADEFCRKELEQSKQELDDFLSYEISRLNYPLKWELDLRIDSIENRLNTIAEEYPDSIFVMSKTPDNYIFDSQKETIDISQTFSGLCLFVPAGEQFVPYSSILIPTGFTNEEKDGINRLAGLLNYFLPVVNLLGRPERKGEKEMTTLMDIDQLFPNATVNYKVLDEGNFDDNFIDYAEILAPSLVAVVEENRGFWSKLFKKELIRKLLKSSDCPVLYSNCEVN